MARQKRSTQVLPCFVFTPETIHVTQKAMMLFAQALERVEDQPDKRAFAAETMQQINGKLEAMSLSVGLICVTTFDSNEKLVIATAIHLHMLDLLTTPMNDQRQKELTQCRQIKQFALDHLTMGPMRTTH